MEKSQLNKALDEVKNAQTGLYENEAYLQAGKLLGSTHILIGDIVKETSSKKTVYTIAARLMKTESGLIIGGKTIQDSSFASAIKKLSYSMNELLSILDSMDNPDSPFLIRLKLDKKNYKINDKIQLEFMVESKDESLKECYLKLYSVDTKGQIIQIYPNKFTKNKKISLGKLYRFPENDDDFDWIINGEPGFEHIQAIATSDESEPLPRKHPGRNEVFRSIGRENSALYRGISVKVKDKKLKGFSSERISFQIIK